MPISIGTCLGPYEILASLSAGRVGEVYGTRDNKLGRDVALKVLPAALGNDAEYMARLQREAEVLTSLNHPNIATLYGVEQAIGLCALAMKLVDRPTVEECIQWRPLRLSELVVIAKQIVV